MSKRRVPWAVCLWPGLGHLWIQGSGRGLALAVGATVILNVLLAATLVWTEWLPPTVKLAGWLLASSLWLVGAWMSRSAGVSNGDRSSDRQRVAKVADSEATKTNDKTNHKPRPLEDLFPLAQSQYLRGNWYEAEHILRELLEIDARDVEARLMLATLLRHTGRLDEAARQLQQTDRLEAAEPWRQEIQTEWRRIADASEPKQDDEPSELTRAA